jgi:penicillin amidase
MIEQQPRHAPADFVRMQQDAVSLRAADCVPRLLAVLERQTDPRIHQAVNHLAGWDFRMEPDRVAASIFSMFFAHWSRAIAQERFEGDAITLVAGAIGGLATTLLSGDPAGWFVRGAREATLVAAFNSALDALTEQFGGEMLDWAWGRMHKMIQKHFLSDRGELGALLDRGGIPVKGDGVTVCNTGFDPNWGATMGAGYRLIADLSDPHGTLRAVDAGSESGHPGSPHYDDQLTVWLTGRYHDLALTPDREPKRPARLLLEPA